MNFVGYGGGRLLVLGKQAARIPGVKMSSTITAPTPINTPSLRKENHGQDVNVNLVPTGGVGWGKKTPESEGQEKNEVKLAPWATTQSKKEPEATPMASLHTGKWGDDAVEEDFMEKKQEKTNRDFPELNNSNSATARSSFSSLDQDDRHYRGSFHEYQEYRRPYRSYSEEIQPPVRRILAREPGPKKLFDPKTGTMVEATERKKKPPVVHQVQVLERPKFKKPADQARGSNKKSKSKTKATPKKKTAEETKKDTKASHVDKKVFNQQKKQPKEKEKVWKPKATATTTTDPPPAPVLKKKNGKGKRKQVYVPKVKT